MVKTVICTECPMGCNVSVDFDGENVLNISGNNCVRGEGYAKNEVICPRRVVTSSVRATCGKMVSVKTDKPVKKSEIFDVMKIINVSTCTAPVKIGDVIVENITEDINLIATSNLR